MSETETKSIEPGSKGRPTAAEIRQYWDSWDHDSSLRSFRSMETKMQAAGFQTSDSAIRRCVARGFKQNESLKRYVVDKPVVDVKASPEVNAINHVMAMAPADVHPTALAEALVEAIKNLPSGQKDRVQALLGMEDNELLRQTSKLVAVARHLLAEDLATHTKMMMLAPDKAARLFQVLGSSLQPINTPPVPPVAPGNGDGATVVEASVQPLSASALAIRAFRAKDRSAA